MNKRTKMTATLKKLTIADVEWTITPLPEDTSPEGHFATGDDKEDALICKRIREEAEWNEWAWCCVEVKAQWNGLEAASYLGACNYESRADFEKESGYLSQMQEEVLDSLQKKAERVALALNS